MTMRALVLHPDGTARVEHVPTDDHAALQALYAWIGCSAVDLVRLLDADMWVDDDGMQLDLRGVARGTVNGPASYIARRLGANRQPYYGVAVFTGGADDAGGVVGVSDRQLTMLYDLLGELAETIRHHAQEA